MRVRITGAGKSTQTIEWKPGKPKECGYYLAAWRMQAGQLVVSELWFNHADGRGTWWAGRGYLEGFGDRSPFLAKQIPDVYAWAELVTAPDPMHWPAAMENK